MRQMLPRVSRYGMLLALSALFLLPAFLMVSASLEPPGKPQGAGPSFANYGEAMAFEHGDSQTVLLQEDAQGRPLSLPMLFFRTPFFRQLANTLIVGFLSVAGVVISSSLAAYAFARLQWPGRDAFFLLTVTTMMVPFAVKLVPLYGLFERIGWIGTLKPLWAPALFGTGFSIFLLRQFFKGIPRDLTDAARIDGCSEFGIYLHVVLPLAKPALAAVALFHFLYVWNDFFAPLVFLTKPEDFTLALGLHQFRSSHGGGTSWPLLMSYATLITVPVIALFFFTQRFFVRGVTMTGIKG